MVQIKKCELAGLTILILSIGLYSVIWFENKVGPPDVIDIYGDTWYYLGYDYGFKCKNKINGVISILSSLRNLIESTTKITFDEYINIYSKYIPNNIIELMHGIADGASVSYSEIFILNLFFDFYPDVFEGLGFGCSAFIITNKSNAETGPFFL